MLIVLIVFGIVLMTAVGLVLARRRPREEEPEAPVEAPEAPPPDVSAEAPPEAPIAEAPPEAAVETPPEAPAAEAPATEAPAVESPVEAVAPPPVEAPPPPPPVVEAPIAEAPAVEAPKRRRVRGIGGSIKRIFRGATLTPEEWEELEEILLRADVGVAATDRVVTALRKRKDVTDGTGALRAELLEVLGDPDRTMRRNDAGLTVWMVTGVNGVGKTTTIGKLAAQISRDGSGVVLAAADTFRAAADTQLERWAEAAGAEIVKHKPGGDPAAVAYDGVVAAKARGAQVLIVDTAGRLQTKTHLMEELGKIKRVLEREAGPPQEVLLVLDATTGQNGVQQARAFAEAAGITGVALTKLDGTAKGGIVIAVQQELGIPVKLVGLGEGIDDLAPFDPRTFVDDLLDA